MKTVKTIRAFGPLEESLFEDEKRFRALKQGDLVRVRLDKSEIRRFTGFGHRSPLIATQWLGPDYSYFFVDGSVATNPQTKLHRYAVDRSRLEDISPVEHEDLYSSGSEEYEY